MTLGLKTEEARDLETNVQRQQKQNTDTLKKIKLELLKTDTLLSLPLFTQATYCFVPPTIWVAFPTSAGLHVSHPQTQP